MRHNPPKPPKASQTRKDSIKWALSQQLESCLFGCQEVLFSIIQKAA